MYTLRDKNGTMKAKLSNILAGKIINGVIGHWDTFNFKGNRKANVFVIDEEGASMGDEYTFGIRIFVWTGDYLEWE